MKEPTTKPLKPVEESQEVDVVNEEDWSDEEEAIAEIQLGFLEPVQDTTTILFRDPDWRNWDGGKVGGWPVSVNLCASTCQYATVMATFCMTTFCASQRHKCTFVLLDYYWII
ncbi:hypothetical protein EON65_30700 [archaeon]|nr:MAG: hypothetical protein EON65_30700 [archaeon]